MTRLLRTQQVVDRAERFERALATRDSADTAGIAIARWILPASLREVSGLAVTPNGRLLAHGDENGLVASLDYRTGILIKTFFVGNRSDPIDFEGITVANDAIFMIVSDGNIYEFREGAGGERVSFALHETNLKEECEFEGIAYDPAIESLLLSCKNVKNDALRDSLVVFRWRFREGTPSTSRMSRLTIPLASVTGPIGAKEMHPSDIAVDPNSGNYIFVAAQERALIEMTPAGEVVFVRRIPEVHEQAEGVAVTKDGVLIISDEAVKAGAVITLYKRT